MNPAYKSLFWLSTNLILKTNQTGFNKKLKKIKILRRMILGIAISTIYRLHFVRIYQVKFIDANIISGLNRVERLKTYNITLYMSRGEIRSQLLRGFRLLLILLFAVKPLIIVKELFVAIFVCSPPYCVCTCLKSGACNLVVNVCCYILSINCIDLLWPQTIFLIFNVINDHSQWIYMKLY